MPSTYYGYRHQPTKGEGRETVYEEPTKLKDVLAIQRENGRIIAQRRAHDRRRARLESKLGADDTEILRRFRSFLAFNYPRVPDDALANVLAQAHEGLAWTRDYNYKAGRLAGRKAKDSGRTKTKRLHDDPFWTKHFKQLVGAASGRLKDRFIMIADDADETWANGGKPTGARRLITKILPELFRDERRASFAEGFDAALHDRPRDPDEYAPAATHQKPLGVLLGASLRTPLSELTPEQIEAREAFRTANQERNAALKTDARAKAVRFGEWSIYVTNRETGEQELLTYPCFWIEVDPAKTTYKKVGFPRTAGLKPSERNMPAGPCCVVWSDK